MMPAAPSVGAITIRPPAATCSFVAIAQHESQSIAGKLVRRGGTGMISCWNEPRIVGARDASRRMYLAGTLGASRCGLGRRSTSPAPFGRSISSVSGPFMLPRRRGPMYRPRIRRR